ncbi:MAG: ABC-F family ATP-binding cassette domain-containing protein [Clostridiales bacterium]|nr:ABC-F family ATP-binding cassette domain-containing protein [Clostridiales bacterium]
MLVMSASNLNKSYGIDVIFDSVSFSVEKGDRIGIVGPNGAGKTTLLSIIAGENTATSGNIYIRNEYRVGYLKQQDHFFAKGTIIEEAEKNFENLYNMEKEIASFADKIADHTSPAFDRNLEKYTSLLEEYEKKGGYTYKSELGAVLRNMGFDEEAQQKRIELLSGGERTRLALCCMLLQKPEILMLDEPTNHLDLAMLNWLEQFLKSYDGTIIIVSHDRFFLDRLTNKIFEMQDESLCEYRGNYSEYIVKRQERMEALLKEYEKQQKEIAKQEEIIRRFKQHNTEKLVKRAQSREKKLAHMDVLSRPKKEQEKLKLSFDSNFKSGNDVVIAEDLQKAYGERQLFKGVNLDIKKGETICIIGDNGVGKTTLLKILLGEEKADSGYLKIGYNVDFGYYDQTQKLLDDNETVLGEVKNAYHLYTDTEARSILGRFLFFGDDVFKHISDLSGGEKAKLSLLKLMLSGTNTLVLDEPTNHLDIDSKEVVEAALAEFEGTLIIVSHDRYLLSRLPDRILELTPDGMLEYKGKFDYYLEKKAMQEAVSLKEERKEESVVVGGSESDRQVKKQQEAEERRRKRQLESIEKRIHELEGLIEELETKMCDPQNAANSAFLRDASREHSEYKEELDAKYEEYLTLSD